MANDRSVVAKWTRGTPMSVADYGDTYENGGIFNTMAGMVGTRSAPVVRGGYPTPGGGYRGGALSPGDEFLRLVNGSRGGRGGYDRGELHVSPRAWYRNSPWGTQSSTLADAIMDARARAQQLLRPGPSKYVAVNRGGNVYYAPRTPAAPAAPAAAEPSASPAERREAPSYQDGLSDIARQFTDDEALAARVNGLMGGGLEPLPGAPTATNPAATPKGTPNATLNKGPDNPPVAVPSYLIDAKASLSRKGAPSYVGGYKDGELAFLSGAIDASKYAEGSPERKSIDVYNRLLATITGPEGPDWSKLDPQTLKYIKDMFGDSDQAQKLSRFGELFDEWVERGHDSPELRLLTRDGTLLGSLSIADYPTFNAAEQYLAKYDPELAQRRSWLRKFSEGGDARLVNPIMGMRDSSSVLSLDDRAPYLSDVDLARMRVAAAVSRALLPELSQRYNALASDVHDLYKDDPARLKEIVSRNGSLFLYGTDLTPEQLMAKDGILPDRGLIPGVDTGAVVNMLKTASLAARLTGDESLDPAFYGALNKINKSFWRGKLKTFTKGADGKVTGRGYTDRPYWVVGRPDPYAQGTREAMKAGVPRREALREVMSRAADGGGYPSVAPGFRRDDRVRAGMIRGTPVGQTGLASVRFGGDLARDAGDTENATPTVAFSRIDPLTGKYDPSHRYYTPTAGKLFGTKREFRLGDDGKATWAYNVAGGGARTPDLDEAIANTIRELKGQTKTPVAKEQVTPAPKDIGAAYDAFWKAEAERRPSLDPVALDWLRKALERNDRTLRPYNYDDRGAATAAPTAKKRAAPGRKRKGAR